MNNSDKVKVIEIESWVRPTGRSGSYRTYLLPVVKTPWSDRTVIYDGSLCFYKTAVAKLCDEGYEPYDPALHDPGEHPAKRA